MALLQRAFALIPARLIKRAAALQWKHPLLRSAVQAVANRVRGRDARIAHGVGRGLWFNPGRSNAGYALGTSEPLLQRAFSLLLRPGMTVLDVGANVGFQSVLAAHLVGAQGRVVGFEPLPENAARAAHNARLNRFDHLQVMEAAVADADGEATFQISDEPNWGRLQGTPPQARGTLAVRVRSIDSVAAELGLHPSAIKIDVEGGELKVLEGARRTLEADRPVLFVDCHGTNQEVAGFLEGASYRLVVLGAGGVPLREARWDAQVVALPEERADLLARAADLQAA
jgi:FkbM family methyltransferase